MRKSLLLFLLAMIMPVCIQAQTYYTAIQKDARTQATTKTDSRLYVDTSVLSPTKTNATKPLWASSYSMGVWVNIGQYLSQTGAANNIVVMGYGGRQHCNDNGCWNLIVNSSGKLGINGWGGQGAAATLSATMPLNQWVHLMVVYDADAPSLSVYMDGELVETRAMTSQHECFSDESPALYFAGYGFNKYIDEVALYRKALSATEVASAKTYAPSAPEIVGLYHFAEVADGTTAQYANEITSGPAVNMVYEVCTGSQAWDNGLVFCIPGSGYTGGSVVETLPTTTADSSVARQAPDVDATVTVMDGEGGTLTITNTTDGTVFSEGDNNAKVGNILSITATPEDGYQLIGIYAVDENENTTEITDGTYIVTGNVTITARYSNTSYALTIQNNANIPFTITLGGQEVTDFDHMMGDGAEYRLTVTVPDDKVFTSITLNGVSQAPAEGGYYAIFLDGDAILAINGYDKPSFTVTFQQPEGGTVGATLDGTELASGASVLMGKTITLTNSKNAGYTFVNYLIDGAAYTSNTYEVNSDVTISALFEEGIDYCEPTFTNGSTISRTDRFVNNPLTVSDGTNSLDITTYGSTANREAYIDATDNIFTTEAGKTISFTNEPKTAGDKGSNGVWMNTFIYADFDLNGFTSSDQVYSNYTGSSNNIAGTFSFDIPANQAPGRYRVRYIVDWNNTDPCAIGVGQGAQNGEFVLDLILLIPNPELEQERTITVASENETYGTVAITDPATDEKSVSTKQTSVTVKATAAQDYTFKNWTDDATGNEVATTAEYIYNGTGDAAFTAHFGVSVSYSATGSGSISVTANGANVANGSVITPGTELTVTVTPDAGNAVRSFNVNGATATLEDGTATVIADTNTTITVEFGEALYTLSVLTQGNGTVQVWSDVDDDDNPAGTQYDTDSEINMGSDTEFVIFVTPDDDYVVESITRTNGDETTTVDDAWTSLADDKTQIFFLGSAVGDNVLSVVFSVDPAGIDSVIGDENAGAPAEYYTLQGVKVSSKNLSQGVYVVRQGSKTYKVLVK